MSNLLLRQRAAVKFKDVDVDVLYRTSNGEVVIFPEEAVSISEHLHDKTITPVYRDPNIRILGQQHKRIHQMIFLTDYVKAQKQRRQDPQYTEYVASAKLASEDVLSENIFKFVREKVLKPERYVITGQPGRIYMYNQGVVSARFIRRYPQGIIWQADEWLVLTCPTHTELMSGTFTQLFEPILK